MLGAKEEEERGILRELGICGIANIPNQIHYLASYTPFDFNVLLMGEVSVGKTSLINRVLGQAHVFKNDLPSFFECLEDQRGLALRIREQAVVEDKVHATIRIVDAPQVGYSVRKNVGYQALCGYAKGQLLNYMRYESDLKRSTLRHKDTRVHVCLYFMTPNQQEYIKVYPLHPPQAFRLSEQDISSLKEITKYTNVLLVSSKSDMLTAEELTAQSQRALAQCQDNKIALFDGEKVHAISFRPDNVKPESSLENVLIRKYLPELIHHTESIHYERFRCLELKEEGTAEEKLVTQSFEAFNI